MGNSKDNLFGNIWCFVVFLSNFLSKHIVTILFGQQKTKEVKIKVLTAGGTIVFE